MPVFGLIDCNSFYCSVERAFQPELRGKALVALSANDGCVIARSPEAKALGIKMGDAWHLIRRRPECRDLMWRSSNFALYGDVSRRIYEILADQVPQLEQYSIDEVFLDLSGIPELDSFCRVLREKVRQITKIPTCVGIGPTKTIAKLANKIAKNSPRLGGVCDFSDEDVRREAYGTLPAGEVWGIGSKAAAKLQAVGVATVADFVALDSRAVRAALTVVGARVQAELRGVSCLPLSALPPARQGLAVTRSFGRPVEIWNDLREAVAAYTTHAAEKLRREGLEAGHISVFAHTNPHSGEAWHSIGRGAVIESTVDTGALITEAVLLLRAGWQPGARYSKAGVLLANLTPAGQQGGLLSIRDVSRSTAVMAAMDKINAKWGRGSVRPASAGAQGAWAARQSHVSPRFATRFEELLVAKTF